MSHSKRVLPGTSKILSEICEEFERRLTNEIQNRIVNHIDVESQDGTEYLHDVLEELERELTRCAHSINRLHNMYQPIAKLPNELVVQVLEYCVYSDLRASPPKYFSPAVSFFSRWRNIALSTPSLWSTIRVSSPRRVQELFIKRCGETYPGEHYPHTVILTNTGYIYSTPELCDIALLADELSEFPGRSNSIKHFEIHWQNKGRDREAMSLQAFSDYFIINYPFPLLQTLTIYDDSPSSITPRWVINAPAVTHLRFRGPPDRVPNPWYENLNLKNLDLEWDRMMPGQILEVLERHQELEHCYIHNTSPPNPDDSDASSDHNAVSLKKLKSLSIGDLDLSDAQILLKHLEIPTSANITLRILPDPWLPGFHLERLLPPRLRLPFDELQITEQQLDVQYTLTSSSESQGRFEVIFLKYKGKDWRVITDFLSELGNLSRVTLYLQVSSLPRAFDLITIMTSWPLLTHLCVKGKDVDVENIFVALESTPEIVCPLLEIWIALARHSAVRGWLSSFGLGMRRVLDYGSSRLERAVLSYTRRNFRLTFQRCTCITVKPDFVCGEARNRYNRSSMVPAKS
ncbi:hypothetical protein SISSUDRAFT_1049782 [Sistotremastrum suecicum HHB10207 ss-3]|uniref:F-box domain-containing protein n=1 Tax=Sistotremastrum suecicum HHB10207 ss-3 TaxID=1314776 RepID=A0A166BJS5_9AGAM|nr:hypothetical protein SISSUDRAFT_1049782 [Sistotremastrum suecicum HHB10207 ss-3]